MKNILIKILAAVSVIGSFFSAVFYVLFKQARDERNALEKEKETQSEKLSAYTESKKENEKIKQDLYNSDASSINSAVQLMQNSAKKGEQRNGK